MRGAALATVVTVLDVLLGVVPGPPPVVIWMARKMPTTMTPRSIAPRTSGPKMKPTRMGAMTGRRAGMIISAGRRR